MVNANNTKGNVVKRPGHARHKDLIARALAANPHLREGGFWPAILRTLLAESGSDPGVMRRGLSREDFETETLYALREELKAETGCLRMPDAWAIDDASMTILLWEVCNFQHPSGAIEKWDELSVVLDNFDEWTIRVVTIDSRGVCHFAASEPNGGRVWLVDEPSPGLFDAALWTERSRNGGLDTAYMKSVDAAYLDYVEWMTTNPDDDCAVPQ